MPKLLTSIWNAMSGYKRLVGQLIVLVAFLVTWLPEALSAAHVGPDATAKIVGAVIWLVGVLHALYKVAYSEEAPK